MKPIFRLSSLALAFIMLNSFCINTYFMNEHGHEFWDDETFLGLPIFYRSFNIQDLQQKVDQIDKDYTVYYKKHYEAQSDKAAYLMKLNRSEEALDILRALYKDHPFSYNITINLGTAYELTGKTDSALIFIKKGLEMNADSHHGSEWFHVKVLEAKLALDKNPKWLEENKLMNVKWSIPANASPTDSTIAYHNLATKLSGIAYQLEERIPFTPTPDPIMANIFNEYGDLLTKYSIADAFVAYGIGQIYDEKDFYKMGDKQFDVLEMLKDKGIDPPRVQHHFPKKSKYLGQSVSTNDVTQPVDNRYFILIAALVIIIGGWIFTRLRKVTKSRRKE